MNTHDLFSKPTRPQECAILIAPPLDVNSFEKDVEMAAASIPARDARGDYAFRMVKALPEPDVRKAWDKDGQVVASLCRELISDARSVGVKVYEEASQERLIQVTNERISVVVLVAHWRGSRVCDTDIRLSELWNALTAIQTSSDPFEQRIFNHLQSIVSNTEEIPRASEIADAISAIICMEAGYPPPTPDDDDSFMDAPPRASAIGRVRDRVDKLFPDFLVPGNCLEFRDGYHKASAVADMFPPNWSGVVELAVCHSLYLAEVIKSGRDDRRILTNELAKQPERCIPELCETFLRLSSGDQNYIKLRLEVFAAYSQALSSNYKRRSYMLSKNVHKALERVTTSSSKDFGSRGGVSLSKDFKTIQSNSQSFFYVAAVMCVLIFVLVIYLILKNQNNVTYLTAIYAIGGASLAGLVTLMIKIGKAYVESSVILIIIFNLPKDDVLPALKALRSDKDKPTDTQKSQKQ